MIRGDKFRGDLASICRPSRGDLADKKVDSLLIHQYRHQTGRRQSSIRKKKAQREVLQKGIRGIREDKEDKGDKGG